MEAPADPSPAPPSSRASRIVLVAAVARNGAIGRDNGLVWRDPEDMRRFRRVTVGSAVLMGRRTWDSLPERFRPLPERRNLVLTRQSGWSAVGASPVGSLEAALQGASETPRLCVIGGAEVYRLALPRADELLLTEVDADLPGDAFFPEWDRAAFDRVESEEHHDARGTPFRFTTYRRRSSDRAA